MIVIHHNKDMEHIYYYKDKPYTIVINSKIKIEGEWKNVIIYHCEYENPDGMYWTRFTDEFFDLFKMK